MATKKRIKTVKLNAAATDSTFATECRAILAFNNACNATVVINTEQHTVTVNVIDRANGKNYAATSELHEVE